MGDQKQSNWYIQYDDQTFQIHFHPNYSQLMYKATESLINVELQKVQLESNFPKDTAQNIPKYLNQIGEAITDITMVLLNFFTVEEKLIKQQRIRKEFHSITTILKVENKYTQYFFERSAQFRQNRIRASCIRLNKFLDWLLETSKKLVKYTDKTLEDNLNQVFLYCQQRIRETLEINKETQNNELNLILIDLLCLILRHKGNRTMKAVLDESAYKEFMDDIEKSNQISYDFQLRKAQAKKQFLANQYIQFAEELEVDPNLNKSEKSSSQYYD